MHTNKRMHTHVYIYTRQSEVLLRHEVQDQNAAGSGVILIHKLPPLDSLEGKGREERREREEREKRRREGGG